MVHWSKQCPQMTSRIVMCNKPSGMSRQVWWVMLEKNWIAWCVVQTMSFLWPQYMFYFQPLQYLLVTKLDILEIPKQSFQVVFATRKGRCEMFKAIGIQFVPDAFRTHLNLAFQSSRDAQKNWVQRWSLIYTKKFWIKESLNMIINQTRESTPVFKTRLTRLL